MADRFPSIEDIDSGNAEVPAEASFDAIDNSEPSDFLARERAALGDDANLFSTPGDNLASVEDDDDDLLGGGGSSAPAPVASNEMSSFQSSFPEIDTSNSAIGTDGTITGSSLPINPATSLSNEPEPEVIREWRERRDLALQHRDQVSADKKAETVKAAHQAIDDFYDNYNNKKEKGIAQTKKEAEEFLKNREDTTSGGTSWERIAKLVDLTGKGATGGGAGSGKAKFRELLISLRKDEKAPGATGV
ncbi:Clathrin light chain [Sphaceloma murrayae]|uniref:Clathrin light chain n=1 Tax=Sphaceloma murrayae TaxID=2082308 RepID=A0A2K1QS54_9PEZI|nr:Clathrin light chain [Sphaceloma murrayae]